MAPYDSDDSLDDDQDYTETDVLLGYASKDSNGGETISKLGGRPVCFLLLLLPALIFLIFESPHTNLSLSLSFSL